MTKPVKTELTLLISSAGRRVALLEAFRQDAAALGLGLRVITADAEPKLSAACQLADKSFQVARCTTSEFVPQLLEISAEEKVDLVVPTIDTELEILAGAREQFRTLGTTVAISAM